MVEKKRYDLILIDLILECEMATPIISRIRELYPDNCPGICVMSAMTGAEKIVEENKITHFIKKPFALETLDEIILDKNTSDIFIFFYFFIDGSGALIYGISQEVDTGFKTNFITKSGSNPRLIS